MTDRELLEALYNDMQDVKQDMQNVKQDMQNVKQDMQNVKQDVQDANQKLASLELTVENETNHNIQLLAENHMNLVDKLNQAIRVQDKSILYEVQVSGLKIKIEHLEKEVAEIKSKIA